MVTEKRGMVRRNLLEADQGYASYCVSLGLGAYVVCFCCFSVVGGAAGSSDNRYYVNQNRIGGKTLDSGVGLS